MDTVNSQMSRMGVEDDPQSAARGHKKKHRHAYHNLNQDSSAAGAPPPQAGQWNNNAAPTQMSQYASAQPGSPQGLNQSMPQRNMTPLNGAPISSAQGKVDPEQVPSVSLARDAAAQYYLDHVYPTMEHHLPPPSSVPFVAVDQGNASPKIARLTLNHIPSTAEALNSTALPLGLIIQPLAPRQDGELEIPVIDFGETGPPRCRRCRAYINPFMVFRAGGNKFICNMCTFPNDVSPEYFSPLSPQGARVDRDQRPELALGTVEFAAPKEYWTREPVPQRWLFLIDVSMEAVSKGFLHAFCDGARQAIYGDSDAVEQDGEEPAAPTSRLPPGASVGFATFDKEVHFYNISAELSQAQMVVMPDIDEPFVPISRGLFVDPSASRHVITSLLGSLPNMFSRVKHPEPALLPALNAALDALKSTGGRAVCLSSLPTWGPGRLFMRERPELRDTEAEKAVFKTEHPGFISTAAKMTENGVGVDFFLAAPQGGYLDLAAIGHVSEKTGGEVYYYPNYHNPRDNLKLAKELAHAVQRESGFQALMKVRCSNGLQVSGYFGNFKQNSFGADLEFGVVDSDKAFGVSFSYDGKLDSKLDAHFQSALLYTTASGQRRIRCTNVVASVSDGPAESMKLVDQDAVTCLLAKQAASQIPDRQLKDIRSRIQEKTIDILAGYRKSFSSNHPPGQLVLPENLKEFSMYMLGLLKSRAFKAGIEPTDRRVHDMRLVKSMGVLELSLYLYPRIIAVHSLSEADGFPNENGHLRMPPSVRASYSRIEEGGAYIVDCGQICLLWLHAQVSPNLLEDLFGEGHASLQGLDPFSTTLPVLETHLNAQVRNIVQYLEDTRGSKAMTLQLARQGLDGAEYEFARLLYEDRNNEAQSYVDWLVQVHRHIQLELQGQRKKEDTSEGGGALASLQSFNKLW
ncbi:MAG: COPII coat Sec23p-Sfb3p heterodimer component [Chrysothrix sp. TS-e1954]|nr:MAG: COPII coat Sec23p-Sfb3p heterodimer component [Chrysothrix sp. TS-e1954]